MAATIIDDDAPLESIPRADPVTAPAAVVRTLFRTARQRATEKPPKVDWVIGGLAAAGTVAELDGPQKIGKTSLLAHAVMAKLCGLPFLGLPTQTGPVVWLTEESWSTLQEPLREVGLLEHDDLYILCREDAFGLTWPEIATLARELVLAVGANLIIVDTLPSLAGLKGDEENSAGYAMEAMRPVQEIAAAGVGVIVTRHDRRAGGEPGESGRGSTAFSGAVDLIFRFTRLGGGGRATMRKLEYVGRIRGVPADRILDLNEAGYRFVGTDADIKLKEAQALLLEHLPDCEEDAITLPSLWAPANPNKYQKAGPLHGREIGNSTFKEAATELLERGSLGRKVINAKRHLWWRVVGAPGTTNYLVNVAEGDPTAGKVGGGGDHPLKGWPTGHPPAKDPVAPAIEQSTLPLPGTPTTARHTPKSRDGIDPAQAAAEAEAAEALDQLVESDSPPAPPEPDDDAAPSEETQP